ncbi:MAG: helix-turn-helix domain-containing protein [Planctomycetota bacterium]
MPAKPFYSLDEVCARLGKSQDAIKAMVREGALREFRDAGKVFFKAEDIEKLAAPAGGSAASDTGEILLEPVAELPVSDHDSALPGLADSGGGTSIIGLEPLPDEEEPKKKQKEDTVITKSGIGVFDDDELEIDADPMAKTQITTGATDDQVSLEGAGSGSGLLDLAREADDTALGADLLDEIYPGEEEAAPAEELPARVPAAAAAEAEAPPALEAAETGEVVIPVMVAAGDPAEGIFSGLLVGGLIVMILAFTSAAALLQGFVPKFITTLGQGTYFYYLLGGSLLVAVISVLVGWFVGKAFAPRRR